MVTLLLHAFVLFVCIPAIASVVMVKLQSLVFQRLGGVGLLIATVMEIGIASHIFNEAWVWVNDFTPYYLEGEYYDGGDRFWIAFYLSILLPLVCLCNVVTAIAMIWNHLNPSE